MVHPGPAGGPGIQAERPLDHPVVGTVGVAPDKYVGTLAAHAGLEVRWAAQQHAIL